MYILIDNSHERLHFFYKVDTKWQSLMVDRSISGGVLGALNDLFIYLGKTIQEITGLAVVVGKGSFTATRVAVTVANTLAYALGLPVAGVSEAEPDGLSDRIRRQPVGQYVTASYSAEARVGKSKT